MDKIKVKGGTRIRVFVTKNQKLRARVTEYAPNNGGELTTEMTLDSESWREGKLKRHQRGILYHATRLVQSLEDQLKTAQATRDDGSIHLGEWIPTDYSD